MSSQIKSKTQFKIVGKQKYINPKTNEVEEFNVTQQTVQTDFNFHKIWLKDLVKILENMESPKVKVFAYILDNIDSQNMIVGSIRKVTEQLTVSQETVRVVYKLLQDLGYLKLVQNGVYQLSPDLLLKGNSQRRRLLRADYHDFKLTEKEQIKNKMTKEEQEFQELEKIHENKIIYDNAVEEFKKELENLMPN